MLKKMNPVLALGSLIALVLYIVGPVVAILGLFGVNGQMCMRLDNLFLIPVALMVISAVVALMPVGPISSGMGLITGILMFIMGLFFKDVVAGKMDLLMQLLSVDIAQQYSAYMTVATQLLVGMGWGLLGSVLCMLISSIGGVLFCAIVESNSRSRYNSSNSSSDSDDNSGLYRRR